jgi:hypothetical protein
MNRNGAKNVITRQRWISTVCASAVVLTFLLLLSGSAFSQASGISTFTRDVAPILQRSCQVCHSENGIGPMPFVTYEQVRRFAPLIKSRVESREMPPWHLDQTIGIQAYKNDISLTQEEIETIVDWIDAGTPRGDTADLPSPIEFPKGDSWQAEKVLGRPPDVVFRSTPYTVLANGQDQWWNPEVDFEGFDETRWLQATEFKPSFPLGKRVVHHGHAFYQRPGERESSTPLHLYGVGKIGGDIFEEGTGMRIEPGRAQISWSLHYFPISEEVPDNVVEVGLWFYPPEEKPEREVAGEVRFVVDQMQGHPRGADILIPPNGYQILESAHVVETPLLIHSFRPHMHMRGSGMSMEAIYPDGRREMLSSVNRYNHNWQMAYYYEEYAQPLLPQGTVLLFHAFMDNTANNPINPDPDVWVVRGQRGVDEMSHAWVGVTYLDEEEYERLAAERASASAR